MGRLHSLAATPRPRPHIGPQLRLLGEFELRIGEEVPLHRSAQRLVAFLALAGRPVRRDRVGGALWGEARQSRADGNLRSVLWRLSRAAPQVVERRHECLAIAAAVEVDASTVLDVANLVLDAPTDVPTAAVDRLAAAGELLPGWDEPWLVPEQERFRQLRLHALELVAEARLRAGDFGTAIKLGLAAVESEPYRESPHRLLVEAHLGEGNAYEAAREYLAYRRLATEELGIQPSPRMEALIDSIRPAVNRHLVESGSR